MTDHRNVGLNRISKNTDSRNSKGSRDKSNQYTSDSNARKQIYIDYYTEEDYIDTLKKLPAIMEKAERKSYDVMEPTIEERRAVNGFIKNFIKEKKRKVYGGTAVNELLKAKNPTDAIYDDYSFKDIEFYSHTPIQDLIELCNALHKHGFKYVRAQEAVHVGTYTIYVNFQLYCDISHVPTNVYYGIKTVIIDDINYTDPHFIWIDHLRMYTDPLTSFHVWEKNFKRSYLLLKHYPLEYFDKSINISSPSTTISSYFLKIKKEFLTREDIRQFTLLGGFDAYNFYIKHAGTSVNREELARVTSNKTDFTIYESNVPYIELYSVNYQDTVIQLHEFIKKMVPNKDLISIEENYPLFQFNGYSVMISYNDIPLVKVFESDGSCIPIVKLKIGIKYVSYQYVLMTFLMNKFKCHLDKNKEMYHAYGSAISNLILTRNTYLEKNNLLIVNDSIFSEFKISDCTGSVVTPARTKFLRTNERSSRKKVSVFRYSPEDFFKQSEEDQKKNLEKMIMFDHGGFPNTSGNTINYGKNIRFKLNDQLDLIVATNKELLSDSTGELEPITTESGKPETETELDSETDTISDIETITDI